MLFAGRIGNREAASILYANCRKYLMGELQVLRPDILVTQGNRAAEALYAALTLPRLSRSANCAGQVREIRLNGGHNLLWIRTYHPSCYGRFWVEAHNCWSDYAERAAAFVNRKYRGQEG